VNRAADLYEACVWRVLLVLTVAFVGAGGLGAASSVALIGLMLAPLSVRGAARAVLANPLAPGLFAAALAWIAVSLAWSPYDRLDQAMKLALLTPLYALMVFAAVRMDDRAARARVIWLVVPVLLTAVYFLLEAALGGLIAQSFKAATETPNQPVSLEARTMIVLARGVTGFVILAGPVAVLLLARADLAGRLGAALLLAAALAGGVAFGVEANLLALMAGGLAAALAWRQGGRGLGTLCFIAAGCIGAAPLYMSAVVAILSGGLADALPISWHMRVEIWAYALSQIEQAPVFGHGLDAGRVLGEDAVLRGEPFNTLPLHAHNAGLHIWLETGFVGAALVSAALAALGWRCMRSDMRQGAAASAAFAGAAYLATVLVGSGVWQEWLHGCLAAGLAGASMTRR
jgi:O-antigen ligase